MPEEIVTTKNNGTKIIEKEERTVDTPADFTSPEDCMISLSKR